VIIPHFTGGAPSLFTVRYAAAIGQLRDFPHALLAGRFASPVPSFAVAYVAHLLASTGFLALLGPRQLALAAPALAINGLSSSTWQHGGGAHYSSEAVPGLIFAAVAGTRWLAAQCWRWLKVPPASAALAIALLGLGIALVESRTQGLLPPAQRFTWPAPSAHAARLRPLLDLIPPGAPVSAQSNVYPHLSTREQIYVFPTVDDAEYVLVDVAGASDPLRPGDLYPAVAALLASPRFELLAGDDGFLVFGRVPHGAAAGPPAAPPPAFYSFVHAPEGEPSTPVQASFEGRFDVVGYRVEWPPAVGFSVRRATPVVYFRPRAPMDHAYRLSVFLIGRDGQVRLVDDGSAAEQWYPTHRWRMSERGGEVIRVRFPPVSYLPGTRLGIGARAGPGAAASRLRVTGPHARVRDGGRVVEVGPLP
jgi:hypothetical protein